MKMLKDKHIVFDIDQTLIYTPEDDQWYTRLLSAYQTSQRETVDLSISTRVGKITVPHKSKDLQIGRGEYGSAQMNFIIRPYCLDLLRYCFMTFKTVIIWSAGSREYVRAIVDNLFRRIGKYPHIVWTYDELVDGIKPLSALFDVFSSRIDISLSNSLLVDDMEYNFEKNVNNGVLIPAYTPDPSISGLNEKDDNLLKLMNWFESDSFKQSSDVRSLDKSKIFEP